MVYSKDFDSSKESTPQGGRFASAEQNIKNKANTARLQGDPTFQVIDSQGNTIEYDSSQYQQYQEQQKQQQNQQRQQEVQRQQEIQRDNRREQTQSNLYPGLSGYEGIPRTAPSTTQYQVQTPDGKTRTFNTEKNAERFASGYGTEKVQYQVETSDGKVRTFNSKANAERFANNYGKQASIIKTQGPSNDVFFVGANAQGYTIKQPQQEKPLQTGIQIIDKPRNTMEQFLEGSSRVFTNFASQTKDFANAIKKNELQSPELFKEPNNPFGLPVPKYQTPLKSTATSELFEGKIPDLKNPAMLGSLFSELGLLAAGIKSGKTTGKITNKISTTKNQRLVEKQLKQLESPKVLTVEKIQKTGPSFPNSGEFLKKIYEKTKFQSGLFLKEGKISVKPVKGSTDLFKIESQNPLQDKLVLAKVKKDEISIKSFEPESPIPSKTVRLRTNPKDELNVELSKFNLEKKESGIYQTKPQSDITNIQKAIGTKSVQPVARLREFTLEQILKKPKEFSRYFFQETTVGKPPLRPLSDTSLVETSSFGTTGTKIKSYPKTELDIPLKGEKYNVPDVFQAFKESKVKVGESIIKGRNIRITKPNYIKKKSILDTFVYDVQKNIRIVDPFSKSNIAKGKKASSYSTGRFKITDDQRSFRSNKDQLLVKPPEKFKNDIEKQIQKELKGNEQDILFSKPRKLAYISSQYEDSFDYLPLEKMKSDNEFKIFIKGKSNITKQNRMLDENSILLKERTNTKFNLGVIPIQQPKITDLFTQITKLDQPQMLTPKITPRTTPKQTPRITPRTTTIEELITTPITTPNIVPKITPEIIPQPRFGFAPYFPSAFFGSGGYESPASLKKAFAAYGISSDINIKTLPTYSRYSSGTNIFKEQSKEDTRIQNLFYGKPKTRSKSKKKSGYKKKSRKR